MASARLSDGAWKFDTITIVKGCLSDERRFLYIRRDVKDFRARDGVRECYQLGNLI